MKYRNLTTIAIKEFFSYLNSPLAYIILVPFLILNAFLFLRSSLVMGDANLRPMIELLPWFLMIIGPALSMRSFSDEKQKDTLELIYAHPISEWQIVLAKFTGLLMFYGIMLTATLPLPLTLAIFSKLDFGLVIGQYLGAVLVGASFLAIGISASALIGNAVGSFLTSVFVNFSLLLLSMSFVTLLFPGIIGRFVLELAILTHTNSISNGVIDLRDLLYFLTLITLSLTIAVMKISKRKIDELPAEKNKLKFTLALITAIALVGNLIAYEYPLKIDLTTDQRYSLSQGSKQLVRSLTDLVSINLYASNNLPGPMQVTLRETTDWLKEFKAYGKKINLKTVITDASPENKTEAIQKGIREVQFNQIGASSFQVATGFLGIEVRFGNKTEIIDFIEDSGNLEYQLSRILLKLTKDNKPKLGFIEAVNTNKTQALNKYLTTQFDLITINENSSPTAAHLLPGVVVVDDGSTVNATSAAIIKSYLAEGGNLLAFIDGMNVAVESLSPTKSESALIPVLLDWGIEVKPNLVYDTQLNEAVTLGSGSTRYILSYPFWVRAILHPSELGFTSNLSNVLVGWASQVTAKDNVNIVKLLTTGPKTGGIQDTSFSVNPQEISNLAKPTGEQTIGILASKENQKVLVIGDTDIISDDFIQNANENQLFAVNTIDWISSDPILSQIPKRGSGRNIYRFTSPSQVQLVQIGNIAIPAFLTIIFGVYWLWKRKQLTKRDYRTSPYYSLS